MEDYVRVKRVSDTPQLNILGKREMFLATAIVSDAGMTGTISSAVAPSGAASGGAGSGDGGTGGELSLGALLAIISSR